MAIKAPKPTSIFKKRNQPNLFGELLGAVTGGMGGINGNESGQEARASPVNANSVSKLIGEEGGSTPAQSEGAGIAGYADTVMDVGTSIFGAVTNDDGNGGGSTGKAIGSGVGAGLGAIVGGPAGAKIGSKVLGTIGQMIGGADDIRKKQNEEFEHQRQLYSSMNLMTNSNPYGTTYEDGGVVPGQQHVQDANTAADETQQLPSKKINIQKGELLIDPTTFDVIRKFDNPNRFSAHNKNVMKEPVGNFVDVPTNFIVVPKNMADRYESGDKLSRKSIIMKLISDQFNEPDHSASLAVEEVADEQFRDGGITGTDPVSRNNRIAAEAMKRKNNALLSSISPTIDSILNNYNQDNAGTQKPVAPVANYITPQAGNPAPTTPAIKPGIPYAGAVNNPPGAYDPAQPIQTGTEDIEALDEEVQEPGQQKAGINWNMVGRKAMDNLPIYYQMAVNAQGDPFLDHNANVKMDSARSYLQMLPEEVDITGNLAANSRSFSLAEKGLNNFNSPSTRAEAAQLLATKIAGDNAAYANKANVDTQMKSNKLMQLAGIDERQGADWVRDRATVMNELRMDKAARENNTGAALSNLSENMAKASNDEEMIKVLNTMSKTIDIDPYAKQLMKEDPNFVPFIFEYIRGGHGDYAAAKAAYMKGGKKPTTTTVNKQVSDNKGNKQQTSIQKIVQ